MQPIAEALARVTLGAPAQFQNLTMFSLLADGEELVGVRQTRILNVSIFVGEAGGLL